MPVLYYHPMSTASRFVRLIFAEYGFQAELVEEQLWEKRKDFIALNPAGTLPVYVDDNMRTLCGATIISEFMDETSGVLKRDRRLLAEDPFQRAEIRRLTEWFLNKTEQDVTKPLPANASSSCRWRRNRVAAHRIRRCCGSHAAIFASICATSPGSRAPGHGSPVSGCPTPTLQVPRPSPSSTISARSIGTNGRR
jgi:glutathione S-transferase